MERRVRGSLSLSEIVTVALEIAEAEGADALTFRRLGKALNAAPTAVLRHFRDKDDLLLAVGAEIHRADAQPAHGQAGPAQTGVFHAAKP